MIPPLFEILVISLQFAVLICIGIYVNDIRLRVAFLANKAWKEPPKDRTAENLLRDQIEALEEKLEFVTDRPYAKEKADG